VLLASRRKPQTLVTFEVDPREVPLSRRIHLLTHAFAEAVRGVSCRRVLEFNLLGGRVRFLMAGDPAPPQADEIRASVEQVKRTA